MHPLIESQRAQFNAVIELAKKELSAIRTGRANPMLLDNVQIEAYGVRTPLKQVASISVPEPSCLLIEPWDKGIIKDVEKSLIEARLGLTPSIAGTSIRLNLPPMTTETRTEITRLVNTKVEQLKMRFRSIRDSIREIVVKSEKEKAITQDDRYDAFEQVDALTKDYSEQLKVIADKKIKEINTV